MFAQPDQTWKRAAGRKKRERERKAYARALIYYYIHGTLAQQLKWRKKVVDREFVEICLFPALRRQFPGFDGGYINLLRDG